METSTDMANRMVDMAMDTRILVIIPTTSKNLFGKEFYFFGKNLKTTKWKSQPFQSQAPC